MCKRHLALLLCISLVGAPTVRAQESEAFESVRLMPGDVIMLDVWREKELSGAIMVEPPGTATFPLLGVRQVVGLPFDELRDQLIVEYQQELRNPSITITPLRRIYVLGEVNQPGLYTLDPTVSLAGAVAMAGGANPQGDLRRIQVVRDGYVVLNGVSAETSIGTVTVRSGDQVFIGRRSWFDRNSTFLVSALLSVTSIVISLLR